jgi:hypothetical protein
MNRVELARRCLALISNIANRGVSSENSANVGFALEELSQVLFERTGSEEVRFLPLPAEQISDLDVLFEDLSIIESTSQSLTAHALVSTHPAEAAILSVIKSMVVKLMDRGGASPDNTCDFVALEQPALYNAVGGERVLELCEQVHRMEDLSQTAVYAARFHEFNREYFEGKLSDYSVHVAYDGSFWTNAPCEENHLSFIDLAGRQIILPVTLPGGRADMDRLLLHHMAHAATKTSADDEPSWRQEMRRLSSLGAPVFEDDLVTSDEY